MSLSKEDEYKEMFLGEALESYEQLNGLFTQLEKDITSMQTIDAIFRITHTLKGNAMGLGFNDIADLSHVMEDIFNEVRAGRLKLTDDLFATLFRANDLLGGLIDAVKRSSVTKASARSLKCC
jgi:two-component system chemotaxis sensor kinase CheA